MISFLTRSGFAAIATTVMIFGTTSATEWLIPKTQPADSPSMIFTELDTGAVMLACTSAGDLIAGVSDDGKDFEKRLASVSKYSRAGKVELVIGEAQPDTRNWRWIPATRSLVSTDHLVGARIFNAVVRETPLKIALDGKDFLETSLPKVDPVFKSFSETCKKNKSAA